MVKLGSDTGQVVLFDKRLDRYVAYGRFGAGGRKVARIESPDFIHRTRPELVIEPDEQDGPNTQFYGITVNLYEGVYVGMLWMFWIDEGRVGRIDFQLCHSRDGKRWVRDPDRRVFLPNGPEGAWDAYDMRGACRSVILPNRILIYYAGSPARHGEGGMGERGMDIGLATLRRDGRRGSLARASLGLPRCRRRPRHSSHETVHLPGSSPPRERERVARPTHPRTRKASARPMTADGLDMTPQFSGPAEALAGREIRLRFEMLRGKLYSFWFE